MTPVQCVGLAVFLCGFVWSSWLFPPLLPLCFGVLLMCIERVGVLLMAEKDEGEAP